MITQEEDCGEELGQQKREDEDEEDVGGNGEKDVEDKDRQAQR